MQPDHVGTTLLATLVVLVLVTPLGAGSRLSISAHSASAGGSAGAGANVSANLTFVARVLPLPGFGVNLSFPAWANLSGGALDVGTIVDGSVGFAVADHTNLSFSYGNRSSPLTVPALGSSGPYPIPGLSYVYSGINFSFEVSLRTNVTALSVVSGGGVATSRVRNFSASAVDPETIRSAAPPNGSAGQVVVNALRNITYDVSMEIDATGSVPFVGKTTVPLLPYTHVASVLATPANVSATYEVDARPNVTSFVALPGSVTLGHSVEIRTNATGGTGVLSYAYSGLPPGCLPSDEPAISCTPSTTGEFRMNVTVSDGEGVRANATAVASVDPPASVSSSAGGSVPLWEVGAGTAVGVAVGLLAAFLLLARRRRPPSTPPPAGG